MTQNDLLSGLREALRVELKSGVEALRFMAEIERRKLYVERGFSSLFRFCVEGLGLTEDQACRRVAVVRAARRVPEVFKMIANGELHMTGVAKLSKFMNDDNAHSLIEQAKNKSKTEVEMLIATEFPGAKSCEDRVEAATPDTFAFHFDGSAEAKALLDRAKELTPPGTDIGEIFEAALAVYVEKLESRKNGKTSRPRSKPAEDATAGAAYVPAATRRAVVERDGAQCTYVSPDGRRCSERSNLEFDHVGGRALGAKSVVGELRLLCRAHNLHAASEVLGRALIDRRIHERRSTRPRQDVCTERPRREALPTPPARAGRLVRTIPAGVRDRGPPSERCAPRPPFTTMKWRPTQSISSLFGRRLLNRWPRRSRSSRYDYSRSWAQEGIHWRCADSSPRSPTNRVCRLDGDGRAVRRWNFLERCDTVSKVVIGAEPLPALLRRC